MNDDILKLYNALQKDGYNNLGTSDEFGTRLQDENNRRKLYDSLVRDGYNDLGTFEEFSGRLVRPMGDQTQAVRMQPEAQRVPEVPVQKDSVSPVVQQAAPEEDVTLNFDDEPNGLKKDDSIRGFFPALAQGAKNMYYGTVNLLGEAAQSFSGRNVFNPLSWGSRNAQEALDELDRRVAEGLGPNERYADPESVAMRERIMMDPNLSDKEKRRELIKNSVGSAAYEEYAKSVEKQAGGYMKGIERLQHNSDIDKMISTALDRAGGNVDEARRILQEKAEDLSLGDRMMNYASEGLAQAKETKGFGAWLGQQIPMLLPSAAAIGLSAVTKNPKYAEWIGKGSFGLMAASSAGETMNRAREYGATDNEVWSAGLTDAAIMYAAGKIPFNRYTGRLFNTAKSQAAKNLSAALADENSLAAKEAEELFNRASKELGMKFNFRTYLGDIAAHGATMSAMSTMQTMVPMIYEHPEDYPTLTNILESSLAGFRDGVFLGATLGAASQGMQIRNNRARWKNQGGIMFAEMESDGGEPVMVEVVGIDGRAIRRPRDWWNQKTDEFVKVDRQGKAPLAGEGDVEAFDAGEGGTVEVLVDGKLESMDKAEFRKRLRSLGRKTFAQVEEAEVQYQTDNAYEEGYNVHEPSERHDAQNMYEYQRQLLKEKTGLDDVSEENVMFYYENENWTPEQKETVLDYLKAKAARRGMIEGIRDDISRKIIAATTAIDDNTSKTDNLVHPATLKDDRRVYVVDGNIVMLEDGSGIDRSRSMHDLLVRDAESGELFFAPVDDFLSVDDAIDPLLEKQTVAEQLRNGIAQEASDQIDGIVTFNPGDEYFLLTDEGHEVPVKVVPNENGVVDNGDGTVNVVLNNAAVDGSPVITPMPKDQIQSLVNAYNLKRLGNYIDHLQEMRDQFDKAVAAPADANSPDAIENAPAPAAPAEPTETEQPVIPVDAQGRKQYMQAPTQATYEDIYSDEDFDNDEEAYGFIAGKVKRTSEALKKSQAAVDKIKPENYDSPAEYRAAKNKALEAHKPFQDAYDYWKGVKDLADADIAEAKKRADRAARLEEQALQEPMSLEEVVANGFRGMEHALDKEDFKRETGMSEAELKRFFPFWAKRGQGMSLQGLAEAIAADDQTGLVPRMGDADQADTQAVRDAIVNVFRAAVRPTDIFDYTRKANIARKEQMEKEAANAAERARLEAEKAEPAEEVPAEVAVKEEPAGTEVPETSATPATRIKKGDVIKIRMMYEGEETTAMVTVQGKDAKISGNIIVDVGDGITTSVPIRDVIEKVEAPADPAAVAPSGPDAVVSSRIADILSGKDKKDYSDAMYNHKPGVEYPDKYYDEVVRQWDEYKKGISEQRDALQKRVSEIVDATTRAAEKEYLDYKSRKGERVDEVGLHNATIDIRDRELKKNQEYKDLTSKIDALDKLISPEAKDKFRRNAIGMLYTDFAEEAPAAPEQTEVTPTQQAIAEAEAQVNTEPTEAQKEAGNYKMGHVTVDGFDISIENPKGSVRRGTSPDGKAWETKMNNTYGYLRRTEGVDGDHIDVFLSDNPEQGNIFVVDQVDPKTGQFDEHKVMYGFNSLDEAKAAYLSNYEEGWQGLGNITEVTRDEFKKWVDSSHRKTKPFAEYKSVKPVEQAPVELNEENYRKAFKTVKNLQEATDDELKSALDFFKASQADNTSKAEALKAKPDYNEKGFDGLSVKGFNEAATNDAKKVLDLENEIRRRNGEAPVEAAPEEPAAVEPTQGTIDFGEPAQEPAAPKKDVKLPTTLKGAKDALDKVIAAPDGKGYKLPEALYVKNAILEMDVNARELMNAETTKDTRDGIMPYVKNYIDKLADDYAKKLEQYGSPENVVKAVNDNIGALKKKVEDGKVHPEDFEQEAKKAIEPLVMLIRKMRYDKPSTVKGRNYEWEHTDESGFRQDVADLLKGASQDVLERLEIGLGLDLPRTVEGLVRNAREKARSSAEAQQYRQMYFDAHPEMPSSEPKGKFDIWKFIKKDDHRPAMTGIFHDKGYKVASDSHILVAVKDSYQKENEGKIIDKKKNVIEAMYPKWRELLQKGEDSGIDAKHLASFVAGVKELEGKNFKDAKIIVPLGGEMRAFNAEGLENFLRAVDEIGGKITFKPLGSAGKSLMLQAEGKKGYALAMNTMPSNWTSPMFHWYATPEELEQMAKQREQDRTVAEATSLVTGRPVEEIEAEKKPAPKPRTPQEKWDAAEEALAKAVTAEDRSAAMSLRTEALQDKLSTVADEKHPAHVVNYDNVLEQLAKDGLDESVINEVRDGLELDNPNRDTNRAFFIPFDEKGIYIIADEIKSLEDGVSAYVHERQHGITLVDALDEKLARLPGFDRKAIWNAMKQWKAGRWYESKDDITLSDEFLSMAMDLAYKCDTPEVFEQELRKAGIDNEEIITFVKTLDNEQRNSESLSSARQVTLFQDSEQGSGVENGGDTGEVPGGNLGSEGNRPAQGGKASPAKRGGGEIKTGPNRQIEDFGEKIAGARKDELRSLSKTLEDATEESFVALPLAKAFKRPNTKKLVENGVITPEDACLVDAVSWLIQGSPKPVKLKDRSWKSKRRDQEIVDWARQQAQRARVVLDYLNADAVGKQAIIDNLANVPNEVKVAADAHRNQILEWNRDRGIQIGELYPLNPIYVAYRVFQSTGYDPDVNGRIKFPIIKCDDLGRSYTVKSGNYGYELAHSVDEALSQATYLVQLQMGVDDIDHPESAFKIRGIRDTKVGSGKFIVSYTKRGGRGGFAIDSKEFDSHDAALEFAKKQYPDQNAEQLEKAIYEPQVWAKPTRFKIVAINAATGEEHQLEGEYGSVEEAATAISYNHEDLNTKFNESLQKSRESKGETVNKRDKLYVAWYYENSKGTYGVWAKDKGFWMGAELLKGGFETSREAREYMEAHRAEYESMLKDMARKRSEFVYFDGDASSRKGKDYRKGKDVGEEEYKVFGFRGVQFGNWANDRDRQAALNNAYDSFMNLAEVLGVSPAALSLNGELGLAFGARGSGSANAHYESNEVVINLTKTRGAGSLAHEWWHALDNYFARRGGIAHGFITASQIPGARPEVQRAFSELTKAIRQSDYGRRSVQKGDYWGSDWEMTARLFAEWVDRKIAEKGESDHFLVRGVDDATAESWMRMGYVFYKARMKDRGEVPMPYEEYKKTPEALAGFPYPTTEEIKSTFGPLMEKVFEVIEEKNEDGKTVLFSKEASPLTTYHGTGAAFERFDLQFLGSGEGTYVYGPGIYVTDVDGIAKTYADVALGRRLAEVRDGIDRLEARLQEIRAGYPAKIEKHEAMAEQFAGTWSGDTHKKFAQIYREMLETGDYKYDPEAQQVKNAIDYKYEQLNHEGKRHLYTVQIPGDNGHNYLPYGEEIPHEDAMKIKAALRARLLSDPNSGYTAKIADILDDELNQAFSYMGGETILGTLDAYLGNDGVGLKSTRFLHDLGYTGIKVPTNYGDPHGDHSANNYVVFDPKDARIMEHVRYSKLNQWPAEDKEQSRIRFSKVTDQKLLDELEKGETKIGYRNVVMKPDGTLGSPMADKLGKKGQKSVRTAPFAFNEWEQAEENPDMATDDGKINLIKPDGLGSVESVDYNPYIHIRPSKINKQFTQAWKRDNLVFVETLYPASELKGEYHAEKAALSVGRHEWTNGDLILSRWDKPMRIVPWEEVADEWVEEFKDRGVTFDIVPPGLLPVLVERGVEILPPKIAAGAPARAAYNRWLNSDRGVRFSKVVSEQQDKDYLDAVKAGDMEKAQRMVDEAAERAFPNSMVRDEDGKLKKVYHGTGMDFNVFERPEFGYENGMGRGFYFTDDPKVAELYTMPGFSDNGEKIAEAMARILVNEYGLDPDEAWEVANEREESEYEEEAYEKAKKELFPHPHVVSAYINIERPIDIDSELKNEYYDSWDINDLMDRDNRDGVINIGYSKMYSQLFDRLEEQYKPSSEFAQYVVRTSNQIKLADPVTYDDNGNVIPLSRRFNPERKDIRFSKTNADEHIFISNAENALDNIKMEKATPEQWLKMLEKEGGLKAGEDKWIGLSDWLRASDKKTITKEEVHDFIRKNEIVIEETHYAEHVDTEQAFIDDVTERIARGKSLDELQEEVDELKESGAGYDAIGESDEGLDAFLMQAMKDEYGDDFELGFYIEDGELDYNYDPYSFDTEDFNEYFAGDERTKIADSTRLNYTTDGLENKQEIALTVPTIEPYKQNDHVHFGDAGKGRAIAWVRFGDAAVRRGFTPEEIDAMVARVPAAENWRKEDGSQFVAKNDLYYPDVDGLDGYFISHNTKRNSFVVHGPADRIFGEFETLPEAVERVKDKYREKLSYNEVRKRVLFIDEIQSKRHQDAREDGGYKDLEKLEEAKERVQQMFRYYGVQNIMQLEEAITNEQHYKDLNEYKKLSKAAPAAPFEKNWHELAFKRMLRYAAEEGYDVVAWTLGEQQAERYDIGKVIDSIDVTPLEKTEFGSNGKGVKVEINYKNNVRPDTPFEFDENGNGTLTDKNLEDYVGKDLAARILSMDRPGTISGDNLRIGAEGMKGFYDDIIPRFANKYGKKWGASTKDILVSLSNGLYLDAHSIEVTPSMKESVMRGQVMFSKEKRETGPFGTILRGYEGKAKEAIQKLMELREGEAIGALSHPEIGAIDLVWGDEGTGHSDGYGLAKLVKYHPEVVDKLQEILNDMHIVSKSENRINLESEKYRAAVRLTWDDQRKTWLLTVFEKKNSALDNTTDTGETSNGSERNDTATPQNTVSESKGSDNSGTSKSSGQKPLFSKLSRDVEDIVNDGKMRVSSENDEARAHLNERMMSIDKNLAKLRMAASAQREYDRETVRSITDLAKRLLDEGALSDPTRQEIEKMLTVTRWATGRKDLDGAVNAIMDLMVGNQLRHAKGVFDGLLKIRGSKVDARGVEVQGKLDAPGQRMMQVFKDAMDMAPESIEEHIASAETRLDSPDDAVKAAAGDELVGLRMAREYVDDIRASIDEEKGIRNELRQAAEDRRAGRMSLPSYREFVASCDEALRQNRMDRINAYNSLTGRLSGKLYESIARGTAFRDEEKQRIERIHHFANSDLAGQKSDEHGNKNDRLTNNGIFRFLLKPLATFDQMLRHFGSKSVNGEGYLWNHFMRGWVDANDAEFQGMKAATDVLDRKVSDVFGRKMRWSDLYSVERKMPTVSVKFWDGGKMQDHELTQGNLLYIYMVNKMSDGRMKLRRMGIEEEHVNAIKEQMDPRFIELADWLQGEFLVNLRNKYNRVHEKLFGAPMAAIENYFPLKVLANARVREVDMATPDLDGTTPATITGSIIKRRKNALALDVIGTDAFSLVIEHLQQMEHWAAFAPFNQDLNTLLSYKTFRNRVQNMSGIYGAGSIIWENFRKSAEIAAGVYHPSVSRDSIDTAAVNIAKGVTAAKISFRVYTAIKQLLSLPAFISDANVGQLLKSMATPWKSWNWALKDLPGFQKRWLSKQAGDTRLMKTESDWKMWRNDMVKTASRLGMSPNAFVDALTVAVGAKAMYETRMKRYLNDGYTREQAEKRAKQDATILFNETQQSNENAFLSAMQLDRTWASVALTVFRNSSMGYQRQLVDAVRNLGRKLRPDYKDEAVEFMSKQMVRDGVDEQDARDAAERNYRKSTFRDALRVALFGFVVQFAWNLGKYLPYLIAGDDDDEKKKMLKDAALHGLLGGTVEGLSGGSVISEAANLLASGEGLKNYDPSLMPVASDIQRIIKMASYDQVAAANEVVNLLVQAGVGVNPQTLTDIGVAIYDACNGDLETSKEATLLLMRVLQCPQSQVDKVYIDELDLTAEKGLDLSIADFARRYAEYKVRRNATTLGWAYSDEAREKRINTYEKRFTKQAQELIRTRGSDLDRAYYEYVDTEHKEVDATLRDLRSGIRTSAQSGDQMGAMEYAQMLNDFMQTPEFQRYSKAHGNVNAIKRLQTALKSADGNSRDAIEDQILQLKRQMVDELKNTDNK